MSTIDILIAVDGAKIVKELAAGNLQKGTESTPTGLGSYTQSDVYISMISENGHIVDQDGKSELTISAALGDTIRWSMTTFGYNLDNTAYLYNGSFSPQASISELVYVPSSNSEYLPVTSSPKSTPNKFNNQAYIAMATILVSSGTIQYTLSFQLIDNSNGAVIGYFSWDPFIKLG
jgi:hypothetical protein